MGKVDDLLNDLEELLTIPRLCLAEKERMLEAMKNAMGNIKIGRRGSDERTRPDMPRMW